MKALVPGETGFIGSSIVRALLKAGYEVRALVRPGANRRNLDGLEVELVDGDITEIASLRRAVRGCERVFHVAALYSFWGARARADRTGDRQPLVPGRPARY
ncbi:NAD-dependent epimerase/dehydratase family protein [Candidatus Bipolaricaulota bacterium]|nr:NAD-dependent epimerase/dehydratase family protein [Candidatus Bipolaricaulota bacterium]